MVKKISLLSPLPLGDCVTMSFLSLRTTEGSAAIFFSWSCEIALIIPLPRNDS